MHPIPGTITDPRVDRILYRAEPARTPKPIRLTRDEAELLRGLARAHAHHHYVSPDERAAIDALTAQL